MSIKRNAARCEHCGDVIESKHQHDFVVCSCYEDESCYDPYSNKQIHGIFVDGGHQYLRHGFINKYEYENLSE